MKEGVSQKPFLDMTIAGYLSPQSSEEQHIYRGLDSYVARKLSEEPVIVVPPRSAAVVID